MQELKESDLEDIMVGCTYLGTGGGGNLEIGRGNLKNALRDGLKFRLMDVEEMGDDDYAACPYDVGSLTIPKGNGGNGGDESNTQTVAAYQALMKYVDKNFTAVIVGEIGPESTAAALIVAARLGLVALDADGIGRAAPEILQYSVLVAGLSTVPAAGVSKYMDEVIITRLSEPSLEEDIFRSIAASREYVSVADAPMPGRVAKKPGVLVTGSISLCRRIGAAFREAAGKSKDPIAAALKAADGYWLFEGRVDGITSKDEDGFTKGNVTIEGTGDYAGLDCAIRFQNENLIASSGDYVLATVPDLITIVDRKSSMPIENPNFTKGQDVVVIGMAANPIWTTKKGLEAFGPKHFGIDRKYESIDKLYQAFEHRRDR